MQGLSGAETNYLPIYQLSYRPTDQQQQNNIYPKWGHNISQECLQDCHKKFDTVTYFLPYQAKFQTNMTQIKMTNNVDNAFECEEIMPDKPLSVCKVQKYFKLEMCSKDMEASRTACLDALKSKSVELT